jgi:hypothetical protein
MAIIHRIKRVVMINNILVNHQVVEMMIVIIADLQIIKVHQDVK